MKPIQFTVPVYGEGVFALLEDRKENFYNYYHRHTELQITYILKGSGTIMVGNMVQSFQVDDVFVLKPDEPHMLDKYGDANPTDGEIHAVHVFVNLVRMQKLFVLPEFESVGRYLLELDSSKKIDPTVSPLLKGFFVDLLTQTSIPRFATFIQLLYSLVQHANSAISLYSGVRSLAYSDRDGVRISEVYKYTFDHFHEDLTVDTVASIVHMTPTSFCKFFKKHSMKTYIGFLNEVRIEKACQLLINKRTESIAEAAFQVGFHNVVHFNRVFKQVTGMPPRQYLLRHQAKS
ncbi:AraC family transcriptional regulator [Sphingobacterium sp. SGG-5]|uniref:AraC family transcriptional regulator n=1 Tax=Sphingobacterium sp. SGG-5 TaxID=2710881 RepID=UPI0013EAD30F|nr:AraC family transcriptional regulator [Sphingobacterium sp. SGG-5]NGM63118.1 AraC family transcriptional regulator [Sphingobacterium sp. SGG-5]